MSKDATIAIPGATQKVETVKGRIQTLYEQTQQYAGDLPIEDENFRYATWPSDDEDRIVKMMRAGWEPALDRPDFDAKRVVLRKDKAKQKADYEKACEVLRSYVNDNSTQVFDSKGTPLSGAKSARSRTFTELIDSLAPTVDTPSPLAGEPATAENDG